MADNLGRVNPVSPHFLHRDVREEPYQGRHSKKHPGAQQEKAEEEPEDTTEDGTRKPAAAIHIDLRI